MKAKVNKMTINLVQGDLLSQVADALVVVTDPNLSMTPQLRQLIGGEIEARVKQIGWSDVGTAVMTDSGNLENALRLIHAVAPRWGEGAERGKLAGLVWECLRIAENSQLRSICMPAISAGVLGYPIESSATIILERIVDYTFEETSTLQNITVCLSTDSEFGVFKEELMRQIEDLQQGDEGQMRV